MKIFLDGLPSSRKAAHNLQFLSSASPFNLVKEESSLSFELVRITHPTLAIPVLATSKPIPGPPPPPPDGEISSLFSFASLALSWPKWYDVACYSRRKDRMRRGYHKEEVKLLKGKQKWIGTWRWTYLVLLGLSHLIFDFFDLWNCRLRVGWKARREEKKEDEGLSAHSKLELKKIAGQLTQKLAAFTWDFWRTWVAINGLNLPWLLIILGVAKRWERLVMFRRKLSNFFSSNKSQTSPPQTQLFLKMVSSPQKFLFSS